MKVYHYNFTIFLILFLFLLHYFNEHVLLWLGLPADSVWGWLLNEGTFFASIIFNTIFFIVQFRLLKKISESEQRYRQLTEISPKPIFVHQDGKIVYANPATVTALGGKTLDDIVGRNLLDFIHPDYLAKIEKRISKLTEDHPDSLIESKIIGVNGEVRDAEWNSTLVQYEGKPSIMVVGRDVTERNRLEDELKASEEQYRKLVEYAPVGIAIHKFGEIRYVNPAGIKKLGAHSMDELVGKNILKFIQPASHDLIRKRWKVIRDDNLEANFREDKLIRLDKQIMDVEILGIPVNLNGEHLIQVFFKDITERKRSQKLMHQLAYEDPLTGLPNRRAFQDKLTKTIIEAKNHKSSLAVMFLDLDGFKEVNDTLGHDIGDLIIKEVALRMRSSVRKQDVLSRLAGDEFTILLPDTDASMAIAAAKDILTSLELPFLLHSHSIVVSTSIGISFYPNNTGSEDLIKLADTAMYKAKQQGKNTYYVYKE